MKRQPAECLEEIQELIRQHRQDPDRWTQDHCAVLVGKISYWAFCARGLASPDFTSNDS